ncbi:hypothetical protein K438DRAFT_1781552 [Mycena galopus ATCC 62051]|nr:hypothetical protein K438DRAFT_1781552 [Mycena galopus ATCC 62051]
MCNTASTSIFLGALSLIPNNRYAFLVLSPGGPIIYLINGHCPSNKLAGIQDTINIAEGTLKKAKVDCLRNHVELMDLTTGLLDTAGFPHLHLNFGRQQRSPAKMSGLYLEREMNGDRNLLQQAARYTHQLCMDPKIVLLCMFQFSRHRFDGALHLAQLVGGTVPIDDMNDQSGQAETQKNIMVVRDEEQCPEQTRGRQWVTHIPRF